MTTAVPWNPVGSTVWFRGTPGDDPPEPEVYLRFPPLLDIPTAESFYPTANEILPVTIDGTVYSTQPFDVVLESTFDVPENFQFVVRVLVVSAVEPEDVQVTVFGDNSPTAMYSSRTDLEAFGIPLDYGIAMFLGANGLAVPATYDAAIDVTYNGKNFHFPISITVAANPYA